MFDMPFGDVEKIAIFRGPQGTTGGLNSQAGSINIVTRDPGPVAMGGTGVVFGSHGRKEGNFSYEGPINKQVSGRIAAKIYDYDGDINNYQWSEPNVISSIDRDVRERTNGMLNSKLVFDLDEAGKLTVSGGWARDKQHPTTGLLIDDPQFPRNAFNPIPKLNTETSNFTAKYVQDLEFAHFTSISGVEHYDTNMTADIIDGFLGAAQNNRFPYFFQSPGLNVRQLGEDNLQISQEIRFDGETDGDMEWVAGAIGLWNRFNSQTDITSMALANGDYRGKLETTHIATFSDVNVPLTERIHWIGGLRLTYEDKNFDGEFFGRKGARSYFSDGGDSDYTFLTGRTGITYDLSENLTAYATIARGQKTGGYLFYNQFAAFGIPLSPYKSSSTWTFETGLKAANLAQIFDISTSLFYNDTGDEQLFTFNPIFGRMAVENADTASYGAEIETAAHINEKLDFGANFALLHSEITGGNHLIQDNEVPYSPKFSSFIYSEYRWDLADFITNGSAFTRIEYSYTGSRAIDPANSLTLDKYGLVNIRFGFQNARFEVFGYVENLLDKDYVSSAFSAGKNGLQQTVFAGIPGYGRSYAIGAKVKF